MKSLNISIPEGLRRFLESQVGDRAAFDSPDEYIRDLIRQDQRRQAREHLDSLLIEGLESGPVQPIGRKWKSQIMRKAKRRAQELIKQNGQAQNARSAASGRSRRG